ncbi:DUF305 domain-containing protein [Micromonospora cathayae]|uniref:DUF305 domain-containing protein n=1 Tax=Micromonospora cathayae TaxID=3028804 RepID=A0ABY7ZLK4_9ACTN|nr:DUF305 domain-containing protein [Micromonospora sp. HUAS 3]WDZ83626.1 DUF305 domain-containing protein [Micromonospora sp. HUAS 3]
MTRLSSVVLLAALLLVTGCTAGASPGPGTAPPPGPAPVTSTLSGLDVVFLTTMVAHTEQTLELLRLSRGRVTDERLRTLVAAIEATESDELTTMRGWLREAGPVPSGGAHRHDHGAGTAGLARLRAAPPGQVDRVLRDLLGTHQRAAADLARSHQAVAADPRVRDLAGRVERSRAAQVSLLAGPGQPTAG